MLTVNHDGASVESDLAGGRLACPGCRGRLRPWGWARERLVRHGTGAGLSLVRHRPRRGRCTGCAATHVLLGVELAARRADTAAVIAAAVEAKTATGAGHRRIAARLGRPASTVRGWLRAFAASAGPIAEVFTALAHRDGADAAGLWPAPAPTPAGRALAAVAAYAGVLAYRFSVATLAWQTAGLTASGPWFFSASGWVGREQHELALTPAPGDGKGGESAG
ncbi:helix-turn-helix domain-containing protein [Specibacter cremeus]|uniref:helix-turn-helix domain-containing protein n=1 Tax=Specibacter cremeus TaxID=1629051 RepID=UPI000F77FBD2|nr:helix-turn-helix domain-containing protein [Specibacter cremeus]